MTVKIDLPPDLEATVREQAARNGQEIGAFVLQAIMREVLADHNAVSESGVESASEPGGQHWVQRFLSGASSVLEFFPSPDRFDDWRLGPDTLLNEWPATVRSLVVGLQEEGPN
jgi:hypothetical protein